MFFYATLNFSDFHMNFYKLLSISDDIFIFSQRHPDEALNIFTMEKSKILLKNKRNKKESKKLKSRIVRIFASLTYQLSLFSIIMCQIYVSPCDILKILFEGLFKGMIHES